MIDFTFRNQTKFTGYKRAFFSKILSQAAEMTAAGKRIGFSLALVNPSLMAKLNRRRGKDGPTDVLSFPLQTSIPKSGSNDIIEIGDIFLCPQRLQTKAEELGISAPQQARWAAIHGFLHLLGYDHDQNAKSAKMLKTEQRIINSLKRK